LRLKNELRLRALPAETLLDTNTGHKARSQSKSVPIIDTPTPSGSAFFRASPRNLEEIQAVIEKGTPQNPMHRHHTGNINTKT
jgi:hypothetical protein